MWGRWWVVAVACAAAAGVVGPRASRAEMMVRGAGGVPCRALLDDDPLESVSGCPGVRPMVAPVPARVAFTEQDTRLVGKPRSETGVVWNLGAHLALQVHYLRTTNAPMMRAENDNGVLTRLRIGF